MAHINIGNEWLRTMKKSRTDKELFKIYHGQLSLVTKLIKQYCVQRRLDFVQLADFGGADGEITQYLREKLEPSIGFSVTTYDTNKELLRHNRSADKTIRWNLTKLTGKDKYDIGLMRYVLNYNSKPNQLKILQGIYSLMKPGGVFINWWCGVSNQEHQKKFQQLFNTKQITGKLYRKDSYWATWKETDLLLKKAGFQVKVVKQYKLPLKDLYRHRYGLSKDENQKVLTFLGKHAHIYYTIFEVVKM